ncbi:MAG: phosphatidylglycerol lysyltransferase domain-containing protein, partial [Candidatus Poribacteria bacterium]|nr:phosphatidylglycerol lysyltransferase domain-containing protein [Candidatus Poribacteria bacterium]
MLQSLTLTDKPLFDQYAQYIDTRLSSYAFAPISVWRDLFRFYWALIDNQLCVFARQGSDYFMPIMPMGKGLSERAIREAYGFMLESNQARPIARIENVPTECLPFFHAMGYTSVLKEMEYLYEMEALIQLKGNRYKSKRAAYNTFVRNYPNVRIQPYQRDDLAACFALYDAWAQSRRAKFDDEIYRAMLEDSRHAHRVGLMNHKELGLIGSIIFIDAELKGYTFGYPLNGETFCVLFEITDLRIQGLAQFLFREFCRKQAAYRWMNAMDDSGLE